MENRTTHGELVIERVCIWNHDSSFISLDCYFYFTFFGKLNKAVENRRRWEEKHRLSHAWFLVHTHPKITDAWVVEPLLRAKYKWIFLLLCCVYISMPLVNSSMLLLTMMGSCPELNYLFLFSFSRESFSYLFLIIYCYCCNWEESAHSHVI